MSLNLNLNTEDTLIIYASISSLLESLDDELNIADKYEKKELLPMRNKVANLHSRFTQLLSDKNINPYEI